MKERLLIVTVPVANLLKEPVKAISNYLYDDLQETQVLYNEVLFYREEREDWYYIEATEQKKMTHRGDWRGYPGWIQKTSAAFTDRLPALNAIAKLAEAIILKDPEEKAEPLLTVSMGTKLVVENNENSDYYKTILIDTQKGWIKKDTVTILTPGTNTGASRKHIIETARLFLGMPYLWGGRSAYASEKVQRTVCKAPIEDGRWICPRVAGNRETGATVSNLSPLTPSIQLTVAEGVVRGVDCSGLTNLVYRVNMLNIPRDARDQWKMSTRIAYDRLNLGDFIFVSAEGEYDKITHVMLFMDGEEFIEAPETGSVITINTFANKFGLTLHDIVEQNSIVNKRKITFGSILIAGEENE